MRKQAIALLVHQDIEQVNALIRMLDDQFDVYVHVDKKSALDPNQIASKNAWKKYRVKWGGYGMVEATIFLYKQIISSKKLYTHIILLSGDTLPVKSNKFISEYLSASEGVSFLENEPASALKLERRTLIWFNEDLKKKSLINKLYKSVRWFQRKTGIKRGTRNFERTGSQWTILALEHVKHLLEHGRFLPYRSMAVPDESFVQNHFYNSGISHRDNLIYAHWPEKRSHSPEFIDPHTFESLVESSYLFARKFKRQTTTGHYPDKY